MTRAEFEAEKARQLSVVPTTTDIPVMSRADFETERAKQSAGSASNLAAQVATGGAADILNTLSFGYGDELIGTGAGTFDYLKDKFLGGPGTTLLDAISNRTKQSEELRNTWKTLNPTASLFTGIAPALINPLSAIKAVEAIPAAKKVYDSSRALRVALPAADVVGQTALYASGEAKPEERLSAALNAVTDPLTLGVAGVSSGVKAAEPFLENIGKRLYAGAYGIRQSDVKAFPDNSFDVIDELRKSGELSVRNTAEESLDAIRKKEKEIGKALNQTINNVDAGKVTDLPEFPFTKKIINDKSGHAFSEASDLFDKELSGFIDDMAIRGNNGTLTDWQKVKLQLQDDAKKAYSKAPGDRTLKDEVKIAMASDVRDYVERKASQLSSGAGQQIANLNNQLAMREAMIKPLERAAKAEEVATLSRDTLDFIRTTGGYGGLLLASMYDSNDAFTPKGALLLGSLLGTRRGMAASGDILRTLPKGASVLKAPIARSLGLSAANRANATTTSGPAQDNKEISKQPQTRKLTEETLGLPPFKPNPTPALNQGQSVSRKDISNLVEQQHPLIRAIVHQESGGNPSALSPKGAKGLMQLMPGTAKDLGVDPNNPLENLQGGIQYINMMLEKFGDIRLALAAYNYGPGAVEKKINLLAKRGQRPTWQNLKPMLPAETKNYVTNVYSNYLRFA